MTLRQLGKKIGGTVQVGRRLRHGHPGRNLLASVPAALAARTPAAGTLRTE